MVDLLHCCLCLPVMLNKLLFAGSSTCMSPGAAGTKLGPATHHGPASAPRLVCTSHWLFKPTRSRWEGFTGGSGWKEGVIALSDFSEKGVENNFECTYILGEEQRSTSGMEASFVASQSFPGVR